MKRITLAALLALAASSVLAAGSNNVQGHTRFGGFFVGA